MKGERPSYEELLAEIERLRTELQRRERESQEEKEKLQSQIKSLEDEVKELKRVVARQAAPFRRREKQKKAEAEKKRPGSKPGHKGHFRPRPAEVDETVAVPLTCCPHCQAALENVREIEQFIEELPVVQPRRTRLVTFEGECHQHGRVRSTHPLQTSTAEGAAGTHLGPRAQAAAVALSHQIGMSMRKVCETFHTFFGIHLTPGGLSQLLARLANRTSDWYNQLVQEIRQSAAVFADETSWYVGCPGWWLWDFTTPNATLYVVANTRGSDVVTQVLGPGFGGILVSDCLSSYDPIDCRKHKCIAHHLRALKEQEEALAKRGIKSLYLTLWKVQLQDVIATWERYPTMSGDEWLEKVAQLRRGVNNLLDQVPAEPEEIRFRDRLRRQRDHLLGCLDDPSAEPTNNRAERDLRPAVISRKISCGNKTEKGKTTWERLRSITATAAKQGTDLISTIMGYLKPAPD